MDKKSLIVLLSILVILTILWGAFYLLGRVFIKSTGKLAENVNVPVLPSEAGQNLEQGRPSQVFKISSGEKTYPQFIKEVFFKPYEVATGDTQTFYVWVKDPDGVATVKAEIETDLGTNNVDLKLVEGDNKEGRWEGSWHVCGVKNKDYYMIVFKAQSNKGQEAIFTTFIKNLYYKK